MASRTLTTGSRRRWNGDGRSSRRHPDGIAVAGDLENRREHCSVDPRKLLELGADVGSQVRILTTADDQVLYTISEAPDEDPDSTVRMGLTARRRFGTDDEFDGVIDSQVPHPTLSDTDAEELGEFVERLHDGASATVIAIAPHGGDIELNTDRQAEHVASRLAALEPARGSAGAGSPATVPSRAGTSPRTRPTPAAFRCSAR